MRRLTRNVRAIAVLLSPAPDSDVTALGAPAPDLGLLRQIEAALSHGDVMLADTFYCNYFLIAALQRAGVNVLFAQKERASSIFAVGKDSAPAITGRVGRSSKLDLTG